MNPYMGRNRHLVVHGNGNRHPLIWVQPGRQQAEVIERLGPEQPVYCVARPYLDRTKHLTFEEIASYHVETVRSLCPEGPYVLVGNYGHAVIAFEMASQLLRQGESVSTLILINPADPAISQTKLVQEPPLFRLRLTLDRMMFHLQKIKEQGPKHELAHWKQKIRFAKKQRSNPSSRLSVTESDESRASRLPSSWNVADSDAYAFRNHVLRPCMGSATLIRPTMAPRRGYEYPNLRWTALFANGLDVQQVPGDSGSMWMGENVSALSHKIQWLCDMHSAKAESSSR